MRKMKNLFRITMIAFAMLFAVGTAGLAGAAGLWSGDSEDGIAAGAAKAAAETAYAAEEGYTYTVCIYSGKEGYFGNDENNHVIRVKGLKPEQSYTIDLSELDLHIIDNDKYYARGVKLSGHDNDEVSQMTYQSYTFTVTKDESFSVAYGMKGGMVKYTVNYVDEDGGEVLPSQEYYGMAGDKPVVSYKYAEGYTPDVLNITKTLVSDESQNVFTFTYSEAGTNEEEEGNGTNADNGAGANNANANANANVNANAANIPDANTPTALVDLDNNETPLTNIDNQDTPKDGGFSGATAALIGIIAAGVLIALGLLYALVFRKRGEEEE